MARNNLLLLSALVAVTAWVTPVDAQNPFCTDDPDYASDVNPIRTCEWFAFKPEERCKLDPLAGISCPASCNAGCNGCAVDDDSDLCANVCSDSESYLQLGNPIRTCEWFAEKPGVRCPLQNNEAFFACPGTCNRLCPDSAAPSSVPSDVPSDLPSMVPSDVPSDGPSDVPSDGPSDAPSVYVNPFCTNDPDYASDVNPIRTCEWFAFKPEARCALDPLAELACPAACNAVCNGCDVDDDSDLCANVCSDNKSYLQLGNPIRSCEWFAEKPGVRCPLQDDEAFFACPGTCNDDCPESAAPSSVPSDVPSDSPSSLPSDLPSFTSDEPSSSPSMSPSDHPSFCSDDPDFRGNGLEKRTCDWFAEKPDIRCKLDQEAELGCAATCNPACLDCPALCNPADCRPICKFVCRDNKYYIQNDNELRTCKWVAEKPEKRCELLKFEAFYGCPGTCNDECPEASAIPSVEPSLAPSEEPTDAPSLSPSIAPTDLPSFCTDDPDFIGNDKAKRTCAWIAEKPEIRCPLDSLAVLGCPATCNPGCIGCADDPDFRYNDRDFKDCDWVAEKDELRCTFEGVPEACPSVCNPLCESKCTDIPEYLVGGNEKRPCSWVEDKPAKRCPLLNSEAFFGCPGTCNDDC